MKTSLFAFAAGFLWLTSAVVAAPTATNEIVARQDAPEQDVDVILTDLYNAITEIDSQYNSTVSKRDATPDGWLDTRTTKDISDWCAAIIIKINIAIDLCKKLPPGWHTPHKDICIDIIVKIILELNFCLQFLCSKSGLLGGLLTVILLLVNGLIIVLNSLLITVAVVVDGLLAAVAAILVKLVGSLSILLIIKLGLVII